MKKIFYLLLLLTGNYSSATSQDLIEKKEKVLLYKFTLSAGVGNGYPSYQTDVGIGIGIEMGVEYKKWSTALSRKKLQILK